MRTDLRLHVDLEIRSAPLPIKCTTKKSGIPHTLVCTKDSADYIRRVSWQRKDIAQMMFLLLAAPAANIPWVTAVAARLRLAIRRAAE
ncbi:MAG: hypothetical protein OXN89_09030 [Bryobacterales bacterium]|nr:hypothetical protein [Bryobacterales bacterium]